MKRNNLKEAVSKLHIELNKYGDVSIQQYINMRHIVKEVIKAYNPPAIQTRSAAAKYRNRMRLAATNRETTEDAIIDESIDCKRYGPDCLMYFFADGSKIVKNVITDEWS